MEQEEIIIKNLDMYKKYLQKLGNKTSETNLKNFIEAIEEDIMVTPASTRYDLVCSYPGGLLEHSLRVFSYFLKLRKISSLDKEISPETAIVLSLLHDIGKLGEGNKAYYLDQKDDWKRNKLGQNYEINDKIGFVPVSQLSLRWLTNYSFKLDLEEWYAISNVRDSNKEQFPGKNEPKLATLLNQAIVLACMEGKNKKETSLITG